VAGSDRSPRVLCFGEALWDTTPEGSLPGGAPMNVALRLAALGIDTTLLSRVGDDAAGRRLVEFLAAAGLPTEQIQIDRRHATGIVHVDLSDPAAVRYDIVAPVAWDFIDAVEYEQGIEDHADAVVFGSLAARNGDSRRSLQRLLDRIPLKVFDVNLRPPHDDRDVVECLLHRADWTKLNEIELGVICGWAGLDPSAGGALESLARHYGLTGVCVTLGPDGAVQWHDGNLVRQPGFDVEVVDTIGCGDAFLGTWLARMLRGTEPATALAHACAAGAIVASSAGANPSVDDRSILELAGGR